MFVLTLDDEGGEHIQVYVDAKPMMLHETTSCFTGDRRWLGEKVQWSEAY